MVDYMAVIASGLTLCLMCIAGTPVQPGLKQHTEQAYLGAAYALGGSTESTRNCPSQVVKDGGTCGTSTYKPLPDN